MMKRGNFYGYHFQGKGVKMLLENKLYIENKEPRSTKKKLSDVTKIWKKLISNNWVTKWQMNNACEKQIYHVKEDEVDEKLPSQLPIC